MQSLVNIIEIVAIIPTLIKDLRVRLSNSSLDVCSIDGHQKLVKREEPNLIQILSDIVPIDQAVAPHASASTSEPSTIRFINRYVMTTNAILLHVKL